MKVTLNRGSRTFELIIGGTEPDASGVPLLFVDDVAAYRFLEGFGRDARWGALRRLFASDPVGGSRLRTTDHEIVREVARWIAGGKVRVVELKRSLTSVEVRPSEEVRSAPQTADEFERPKTWIEIVLVDMADKPVPGVKYAITIPEGVIVEGRLDSKGRARVDNIDPGTCEVRFPELDSEAWSPA